MREITLRMDEDIAYWLRELMITFVKSRKNGYRIVCAEKDCERAQEMTDIIPSDVKPFIEPWLRDLDVKLEID